MIASESVLCTLALHRGVKSYRPGQPFLLAGRRMVEILVRDSVWYFVMHVISYVSSRIVFLTFL